MLQLVTGPTVEPITLSEVKRQCVIDWDHDDLLLESLILASRNYVETLCGSLITQTWSLTLQSWPVRVIKIGKPRIQTVNSIKYTDSSDVEATLSASAYYVDAFNSRVILKSDQTWPTTVLAEFDPIVIEFDCGYGDEAMDIPEPLRIAMLMLCSHWYENREPVNIGNIVTPLPFSVEALIANYRYY
jgi:uncharacterized phiE125 gp8 family phage protein